MVLIMGTIFLLSHQPGGSYDLFSFFGADKVAHMIAYGVLAATVIAAFSPGYRQAEKEIVVGVALLVSLLYGISDEFHQSYIPGRFSSIADIVADVVGTVIVCLLFWLYTVRHK